MSVITGPLVLLRAGIGGSVTATDPGEGVVADPASITVTDLAPGQSVSAATTITNDSTEDVVLGLTQTGSGMLLTGAHPLQVTYRWDTDGLARCDGAPVIPAGTTLDVQVSATLPVEAGNEYQGQTGTSELTFTATTLVDGGCPDQGTTPDGGSGTGSTVATGGDSLAVTGHASLVAWALIALLVGSGIVIRRRERRPR